MSLTSSGHPLDIDHDLAHVDIPPHAKVSWLLSVIAQPARECAKSIEQRSWGWVQMCPAAS